MPPGSTGLAWGSCPKSAQASWGCQGGARGKVAKVHRGGGLREPWVGRTPVRGQRASSPAPGTGELDAAHRQEVSSPIILSTPSLLHLCVCLSVGRKSRERTPSTPKEIREPSILHTPPRCPQGITAELFP